MEQHLFTVYPAYSRFIRAAKFLPISARSIVIKCCQAQLFPSEPNAVLSLLIDEHPEIIYLESPQHSTRYTRQTLRSVLDATQFDPSDPLESAIYLDILRAADVDAYDIEATKAKSWAKEVSLVNGTFRTEAVDWGVIFDYDRDQAALRPLHPDLPINPGMANEIHRSLLRVRDFFEGQYLYSRSTHKMMSHDTVREFEELTRREILGTSNLFGQDNCLRYYHDTGHFLGGATEMRQYWPTSAAKPRTYYAMGGEAYQHSRFLQDFFSTLVDSVPSFNHKTRLRPGRLAIPREIDGESLHWLIYDLSSFTSNCCIQRSFCHALSSFFSGVDVIIVDEHHGPICSDLGELLLDYTRFCVEKPSVSLARFDPSLETPVFYHETASMLGIFGNLMSCTFAHGTVVALSSPDIMSDSYNCAGDDGLVPKRLSTSFSIDRGIRLVGSYELQKSFPGDDPAPVCLKRPFAETFPQPTLKSNLVPPSLATAIIALTDIDDPRYHRYPTSYTKTWVDRVDMVGKDLLRFLRSAYRMKYAFPERLGYIVRHFERLVLNTVGWMATPGITIPGIRPFWPVSPENYEFDTISPLNVVFIYFSPPLFELPRREELPDVSLQFSSAGEVFEGNSTKRLKLLETLGYLTKEELVVTLSDKDRKEVLANALDDDLPNVYRPIVYKYELIRDIPIHFMFSD